MESIETIFSYYTFSTIGLGASIGGLILWVVMGFITGEIRIEDVE